MFRRAKELSKSYAFMQSEVQEALNLIGKEKGFLPDGGLNERSQAMSMRLTAALRHWSQAVLRRRGWVPSEFLGDTPKASCGKDED